MTGEYDAQVRQQLADAQQALAELQRRYDDEHATAVARAQEADRLRKRLAAVSDERNEAQMWARHGYEIGQRHCGWTDHGVAPGWLTGPRPPRIDACKHLTALGQAEARVAAVRALHSRDDSNPLGPWCDICLCKWPCRTAVALGGPSDGVS